MESVAELRSTCEGLRSNPTPTVNPSPFPLIYLLPLSLVPPLTFFFSFITQQIELLAITQSARIFSRPLLLLLENIEPTIITIGSLSSS
jgi:hypothetical protein